MTQVENLLHENFLQNIEREEVVRFVRQWGGTATSAVLDPASQIYVSPGGEGLVGYRHGTGCAVVFGEPIAPPSEVPTVIRSFHAECEKKGWNPIYITVGGSFAKWMREEFNAGYLTVGEEISVDPFDDPTRGAGGSLARRKARHAGKEGVTVSEYFGGNLHAEKEMEHLARAWLENRKGPQVYISNIQLFQDREGKRWFFAREGTRIVGVVVLNRLESKGGWLLNHLMCHPDAPHGTSELLVTTVFKTVEQEGCHYVTFGVVAAESLNEILGFGSVITWSLPWVYKSLMKMLRIEGRKKYWSKYQPNSKLSYVVFTKPQIGLRDVFELLRIVNVAL